MIEGENLSYQFPMSGFFNLQTTLSRLRKWFSTITAFNGKRLAQNGSTGEWAQGLPEGMSREQLQEICIQVRGEAIRSTRYEHLSSWKEAGAYRIAVQFANGTTWCIIYKDAVYSLDQIPALKGLPYHPGPSEYALFHSPPRSLQPFLPQCFWTSEVQPGRRYRYVFEDLVDDFTRIQGREGLLEAVEMLLPLEGALRDWRPDNQGKLLFFDGQASQAMEVYAEETLRRYFEIHPSPLANEFLANWPDIRDAHRVNGPELASTTTLVHGDLNTTNIYVHKSKPGEYRLVDWEWAGWGNPYLDLACLLKRTPVAFEEEALAIYARNHPERSFDAHWMAYQWHQLDRGLLDGAYIAAQLLENPYRPEWDMAGFMEDSLEDVISRTQILSSLLE